MGLPEPERFTIEDIASRWNKSAFYVEEMLRTLKFKSIIVEGELIGGSELTRHLYFDRDHWTKQYGKECAHQNIGQNEVANLWAPFDGSKEWKRPGEGIRVSIPRVVLEAFEAEHDIRPDSVPAPSPEGMHGIQNEPNAQKAKKKDKRPASDPSEIDPNKWYGTNLTARFLGMNQKYVQNNDILKQKLAATKRGGWRWHFQGQKIRDYMQKTASES